MCVSRLALQVSHLYYGFEMQCLREVLMKPRLLFPSLTLGSHSIMLTRECVCVCVWQQAAVSGTKLITSSCPLIHAT